MSDTWNGSPRSGTGNRDDASLALRRAISGGASWPTPLNNAKLSSPGMVFHA
ncbi:MAG: hypothetical protein J0H49_30625 [Acidobacteria bacterium]|nr:hypothetical protein [Acidobacteriota bacterium]